MKNKKFISVFFFFLFIMLLFVTHSSIAQASILDTLSSVGNGNITSRLYFYYDFNDTNQTAVDKWNNDAGGLAPKQFNLTLRGGGTALNNGCSGVIGDCLFFSDSQSGTKFLNNTKSLPNNQPIGRNFTINFWLRLRNTTTGSDYTEYYFNSLSTVSDLLRVFHSTDGKLNLNGQGMSNNDTTHFKAEWHMFTFSQNGLSRIIYIDGLLNVSGGAGSDDFGGDIRIGADGGIVSFASFSDIDEFGIWNTSLSASQTLSLYNAYNNYTGSGGSAPLLLSPIPDKQLNFSHISPQTISITLSNHFSGYSNYTLRYVNRTGQYTGLNSITGNSIEEGVENYTADFYHFTLFFDADKNVSNLQIPTITRNFQDIDNIYEMNLTACNSFGCNTDLFNLTLKATYTQSNPPIKLFNFPYINLTKSSGSFQVNITQFVANAYQVNVSAVSGTKAIFNIFVSAFCSPLEILGFGFFGFCQTKDFNQYNNYDSTITLNPENASKNGNGTINVTLFNENGNITMTLNFTISGIDEPYPILTSSLPDVSHNLAVAPTKEYQLNLTDNFYNFSEFRIELLSNATNSFVNLSKGNYTDGYVSIFQRQNSNITLFNVSMPLSNYSLEVKIYVNATNGSVQDTFNFVVVNTSNIPKPTSKLNIPYIINISESGSYLINISDNYANYTGFYIEFNNITGQTETLTDAIAPDSFETPSFNITINNNETISNYGFSIVRFMNVNLTVCNSINCSTESWYLNMSGGKPPVMVKEFLCPSGETFSSTTGLDFDLGLDVDLDYDLNEYYTNFTDIYLTFKDIFSGSNVNITQGENYTNTSIIVDLTSGFIFSADLTDIPEPFYTNITACNENGCIKEEFALCVPSVTTSSIFRSTLTDLVGFFASLFPDADSISAVTRYMYVFITLFFVTLILGVFGFIVSSGVELVLYATIGLTLLIDFLLVMMFIAIGYIGVGAVVLFILILLAIISLKIFGG